MKKIFWLLLAFSGFFIFNQANAADNGNYTFEKIIINSTGASPHQIDVFDVLPVWDNVNCSSTNYCLWATGRYENNSIPGVRVYVANNATNLSGASSWEACNLLNNGTTPSIGGWFGVSAKFAGYVGNNHVYLPTNNTTEVLNYTTCLATHGSVSNTTGYNRMFVDENNNTVGDPDKLYIQANTTTGNDTLYIGVNNSGNYSWVAVSDPTIVNQTMYAVAPALASTTLDPVSIYYLATNHGIYRCNLSLAQCETANWTQVNGSITNAKYLIARSYYSFTAILAGSKDGLHVGFDNNTSTSFPWVTYNNSTLPTGEYITGIDEKDGIVYVSSFHSTLTGQDSRLLDNFDNIIKDCRRSNAYFLNSIEKGGVSIGNISNDIQQITWTDSYNGSNFFSNATWGIHRDFVDGQVYVASLGNTCNSGGIVHMTPAPSIYTELQPHPDVHFSAAPIVIEGKSYNNATIHDLTILRSNESQVKLCANATDCGVVSSGVSTLCANDTVLGFGDKCYIWLGANSSYPDLTFESNSTVTVSFNYTLASSDKTKAKTKAQPNGISRIFNVKFSQGLFFAGNFSPPIGGYYGGNIWLSVGTGNFTGTPQVINALAQYNADLFAGGNFTLFDIIEGKNTTNIAKYDGWFWRTMNGTNGPVNALFGGTSSNLYVGGNFTIVGNDSATNVTANNTAVWYAFTGGWDVYHDAVNNTVNALLENSDGVNYTFLYVGGKFTQVNSSVSADYAAVWDNINFTWSSMGSTLNGPVNVFAGSLSPLALYAGGEFTTPGQHLAQWNGTEWVSFSGGVNGNVFALLLNGTDLFVGGAFTQANSSVNADNVVLWNGTAWNNLSSSGTNGQVNALALYNNSLYVGGNYTQAGGSGANNISVWNSTTGWSNITNSSSDGVNGTVNALLFAQTITVAAQ
ncbi:MAG: hypothetical protein M1561_00085 [Gammaproteobacteria bacterium]|nr:hypothetical protein [Gammaproteobacteria bacterium]